MQLTRRLNSVKKNLIGERLDAILVSSVPNIIYLTGYSGFSKDEREAYLMITPLKNYIVTDGRYSEAVQDLKDFSLIERAPAFPYKDIFKQLSKKHAIQRLGIEEDSLSVSEYKKLTKLFKTLTDAGIKQLRVAKEEAELKAIEKACAIGDLAFTHILKLLKLRISEKEIVFELETYIKRKGVDVSFSTLVAFGKGSSIPHYTSQDKKLTASDKFVLLDFGVKVDNYCSDMTRTIFFGKASSEQKKMYQTVLDAQQKATDYLQKCHSELVSESRAKKRSRNKFGMTGKNVDKVARDYIISQGYPSIPHSLGHGIGLEVHESPSLSPKSKDVLKIGMVFSVEPGIYIPKFGGVRIEDLVVLENNGPRVLTKSPKELIEL